MVDVKWCPYYNDINNIPTFLWRYILKKFCEVLTEIGCISENRTQHDFIQLSYYYIARVIGEKGKTQYTQNELDNGSEVKWFLPKECERIIYNQEPINYQFSFIRQRDLEIFKIQ